MKKIILSLVVVIALISCTTKEKDAFSITGTIADVENGTKVYLKRANQNNQPVNVDTTTVENASFTFKGKVVSTEMQYIFIDGIRGNIPIIIESADLEITAFKDSLNVSKITGSPQNDKFFSFIDGTKSISKKAMSINNDMRAAMQKKDSVGMQALRDEYFEIQEEAKNFEFEFAEKNTDALISALIIQKIIATKSKPTADVEKMYNALTPEIKETEVGKKIGEMLSNVKLTSIGSMAPNFSGPAPDGKTISLNDAKGKITIIDFWAAWCKPCRAENPNVVRIYNKYHEKGLNIIGVSLDKKAEDWKKAIADDGLTWNHVSNLAYFNDPIAKSFNINSIPATFILDAEGKIIAKNLRGAALEEKIASLLN